MRFTKSSLAVVEFAVIESSVSLRVGGIEWASPFKLQLVAKDKDRPTVAVVLPTVVFQERRVFGGAMFGKPITLNRR